MKKRILIFVVVFMLCEVGFALACSCVPPQEPEDELKKATAVFTGEVVEVKTDLSGPNMLVYIKVDTKFKGDLGGIVVIKTNKSSAACGYPFAKNLKYLVYAEGANTELFAGLCSRTKELNFASEELDKLERISPN